MNWIKEQIAKQMLRFSQKGMVYFGHGIARRIIDPFIEHLHMQEDLFVELIRFWKRMGIAFISMEELLQMKQKGFRSDKAWLHFTFDDGYQNNLTTLLPIMEAFNIPFTVFVTPGLIEQHKRMPGYIIRTAVRHALRDSSLSTGNFVLKPSSPLEGKKDLVQQLSNHYKYLPYDQGQLFLREIEQTLSNEEWSQLNQIYQNDQLLTMEELKTLSKNPLVNIGLHGWEHIILHKDQPESVIRKEFEKPNLWMHLNNIPHLKVHAYPNGRSRDYTSNADKVASSVGADLLFSTIEGAIDRNLNQEVLPRFMLTPKAGWIIKKLV